MDKKNSAKNKEIIFMTGVTSGFGKLIAKKAANKGNLVVFLARNQESATLLINEFNNEYNKTSGSLEFIIGDLSSFQSIVEACEIFKNKYGKINQLINNAGIMNFDYKESKNNIEETFQVNTLSPILITHLLYDCIEKGGDSKIIFTSSGLHQGTMNFDDIEFKNKFSSFKSYRQSKLGIILLYRLLSKRMSEDKISIFSVHPGMIRTNLGKNASAFSRLIFWVLGKPIEKGIQTHLHLMNSKNVNLVSGEYYADAKVTKTTEDSYDLELAKSLHNKVLEYLTPFINYENIIVKQYN